MNTRNKQLVGSQGDDIVIFRALAKMSKADALLHAAWIVAQAETEEGEFQKVLDAVMDE